MSKFSIEKSIEIKAPVSRIWRVFTDPTLTRQMGGEYVSGWKVGSSFGWRTVEGPIVTNGTIMKIRPEEILQHTLLNSVGSISSVITYEFAENNGITTVLTREDFTNPITDEEYGDAADGWTTALRGLKVTAENINHE